MGTVGYIIFVISLCINVLQYVLIKNWNFGFKETFIKNDLFDSEEVVVEMARKKDKISVILVAGEQYLSVNHDLKAEERKLKEDRKATKDKRDKK